MAVLPTSVPPTSPIALRCVDVRFAYGSGAPILNGVTLSLPHRSLGVLFGESGTGKSTLLKIIAGYLPQSSGVVELHETMSRDTPQVGIAPQLQPGWDLTGAPAARLMDLLRLTRRRAASESAPVIQGSRTWLMFADDRGLLHHLTARENLELVLVTICEDIATRVAIADTLLELVQLSHVASHRPAELSTGQSRRLSLAQSLAGNFDVLLLDEPTSSLDSAAKYRLVDLLQTIHAEIGLTGLVVSHDIEAALLLADEVFLFRDGSICESFLLPTGRPRHPEDLDDGIYRECRRRMLSFLMSPVGQ